MRAHCYSGRVGPQSSQTADVIESARRRRRGPMVWVSLAVLAASCSSGDDTIVGDTAAAPTTAAATTTTNAPGETSPADTEVEPVADVEPVAEVEPEDGPAVVIEGDLVVDPDKLRRATGTFEVTEGADVLGCSSGTVIEDIGRDGIDDRLTCEVGDRPGSFTLRFFPPGTGGRAAFSDWSLVASTEGYDDATGSGEWAGRLSEDRTEVSFTYSGDFSFGDFTPPTATVPRLTQFRDSGCPEGFVSADGRTEFMTVDHVLLQLDITSGAVTEHGPSPATCAYWLGDGATGRRVAISGDRRGQKTGDTLWLGPDDGPWETELEFDQRVDLLSRSFAGNRLLLRQRNEIIVIDATTGEQIGAPITGNFADTRNFLGNAVNSDGSLIAIGDGGADGGRIIVLDAQTAEEVFRLDTVAAVTTVMFDDAAGELIAGLVTGELLTIDIAAAEVVSEVAVPFPTTIGAIGVRPDGLIVVYSNEFAELVDRRTGPTGPSITFRNAVAGLIQPDGSITTLSTAQEFNIYEING